MKTLKHSATLLEILHAIVAVDVSAVEMVLCNAAEVESNSIQQQLKYVGKNQRNKRKNLSPEKSICTF